MDLDLTFIAIDRFQSNLKKIVFEVMNSLFV